MPRWMYSKDEPEGRIFQDEEPDPQGWVDSPAKIEDKPRRGRPPKGKADDAE